MLWSIECKREGWPTNPKACGHIRGLRACSEGDGLSLHCRELGQFPEAVTIPLPSTPGLSGDLADAWGMGLG